MTNNLPVKQGKNRNNLGRFKEGISGNPEGRPKGSIMQAVDQAVEEVETTRGKSLLKHLVERAYVSDKVMIALMNKLIPNAKPKEIEEEAKQIEFVITHTHNQEKEECLKDCFDTWKENKGKAQNN
jgi:hypothetical protein